MAASYVLVALVCASLGWLEVRQHDREMSAMARERGAVLFRLVELTRDWNAGHGGVYVPVTPATQPNPYLEDPKRDIVSTEGLSLTKVNPAFMTRQLAELAAKSEGVQIHITSLNPIRPANRSDPWEAESLAMFENNAKERISAFADQPKPVHRYMAPLLVKPACMRCHEKQGYQVGQVRGGISVTMPADDLLRAHEQQNRRSLLLAFGTFVVVSLLAHVALNRARRRYLDLENTAVEQENVIAERTRELTIAGIVFEHAAEGIVVTDAQNRILRVNPAFTAITGYKADEVQGRNPNILESGRHDAAFYAEMWQALAERGHWEGEIWNRHKSGNLYAEWLAITTVPDEAADAGKYVATFTDITQRKYAEEQLHHKAHHDPLTDLPNRALFRDRLEGALAASRRYGRSFALLAVDLDYFKEVNDSLGHAAGDELLVEVSRRLTACVREADTVARLGGDEFGIILAEVGGTHEIEHVAARAIEALQQPFQLTAGPASISGSIGIAAFPLHGESAEELQHNADETLYAVKKSGRNGYRMFDPDA